MRTRAPLPRLAANPAVASPLSSSRSTIGPPHAARPARERPPSASLSPPAVHAPSAFAHDFSRISLRGAPPIQLKLQVNTPGDAYEREADRVADAVMRSAGLRAAQGPEPRIQRQPLRPLDMGRISAPPIVDQVIRSPGHPLDGRTRAFMEPRFGHDFSQVRVHTDARAAQSAASIHARAFTAGPHVVFAASQYAPATDPGRRLLAHELAHTVQQQALAASSGWRLVQRQTTTPKKAGSGQKQTPMKEAINALKQDMFPKAKLYTVKPGDSLTKLAQRFLGAASRWREIYEENRAAIGDDPNQLEAGTELMVHTPVNIDFLPEAVVSALDPKGGLMKVKGELLQYVVDHVETRKFREAFEEHIRSRVLDQAADGSALSGNSGSGIASGSFKGVYTGTLVEYGGNPSKPSEYLSTGTWLLGHCYPAIRYKVAWTGNSLGGWTASWTGDWVIDDDYDLEGGSDKSKLYQAVAKPATLVWHDLLGGRKTAPLQARWKDQGTVKIESGLWKKAAPDKTVVHSGAAQRAEQFIKENPTKLGLPRRIDILLVDSEVEAALSFYSTQAVRYPAGVVKRIRTKVGLPPTGAIDKLFVFAVARYQRRIGLTGDEVDGKAGYVTLTYMFGEDIRPLEGSKQKNTAAAYSKDKTTAPDGGQSAGH